MANLSVILENLRYNIEEDHEDRQFMHEAFAKILWGILEQAQEVYARYEIAKGMSEVATTGFDYLIGVNARAEAQEAVDRDLTFWFSEDEDY
jgi:hypothetical protein